MTKENNLQTIDCPQCGCVIEVDKALGDKMAKAYEKQLNQAFEQERRKVREQADRELSSLQKKLDDANANELQLRRQKTELEQRAKDMDLEVQRRLDEEKSSLERRVADRLATDHRAKDAEKDKKLADTLAQVEELKRRMEQGSQQTQGETLEAEIEEILRVQFPLDKIDPVSPGVKGGDILQTIFTRNGIECGRILWEIKRTKAWSDGWIAKIKSDARNARADECLIASETLPKALDGCRCGSIEGVWVSSPSSCIPLAQAIRHGLVLAAKEKYVQAGRGDKAGQLYEYFTGVEFKNRIGAIIDSYMTMKSDLDSERRAMEKVWAKREKQIIMVISSLSGMHGEIEAIAAGELPVIPALQLGNGK